MGLSVGRSKVSPIGVDFGGGALKIAQLDLSGKNPRLVAAAMLELPEDFDGTDAERLRLQAEAVPKLIKGVGFKGKRAVGALGSWSTIAQPIRVAAKKGEVGEDAVMKELGRMTGEDAYSMIARWWQVGAGTKPNSRDVDICCVAASRQAVQDHIQALKIAKLDTVGVHPEHIALVRAFDPITRRTADQEIASLYVDIGAATTKVVVTKGRNLLFARTVAVGARALQLELADEDERRQQEAEEELRPALPDSRPLMASARTAEEAPQADAPTDTDADADDEDSEEADGRRVGANLRGTRAIEDRPDEAPQKLTEKERTLCDDIGLGLRYHGTVNPGKSVERVIFVGGGSSSAGLCRKVARTLRLSVRVADPLSTLEGADTARTRGVDIDGASPGWSTAIGLCLAPTAL